MHRTLAPALVVLLASAAGWTDTKPVDRDLPRTLPELEAEIRAVLQETRTPGAGIALVSRDQVLWATGIGSADVARGRPATADTLFRIGSITKSLVGLAVLMLVEEAKLRLADRLRPLLPEVAFSNRWEPTDPVRVVHLLEHTTGFADWSLRTFALDDPRPIGLLEGLAYDPASRTSRWRPGTRMSYSNSGAPLAAAVVERVTGTPFEAFVQTRIFDPLQMTTATFRQPDAGRDVATLYHPDGVTPLPYWNLSLRPAGAVNASAAEMARYVQLYLNRGKAGGRQLLSPASLERMEVPRTTAAAAAGLVDGYGLGNYATASGGFVFHGHDGGLPGGVARMAYSPELGVGWVVLLNSASDRALNEVSALIRNYLTRDVAPPAPPPTAAVSEATRYAFTGWYVSETPRHQLFQFVLDLFGLRHLRVEEGGLEVRPMLGPRKDHLAVTDRLFREKDAPVATLALLDTPEGPRVATPWGSFRRVPTRLVWLQTGLLVLALAAMVSAVLFALVWVPRRLFGKLRRTPAVAVRVMPLLAVLCLGTAIVLTRLGMEDPFLRLGQASAWSVGLCLVTWAFALTSLLALLLAFGPRSRLVRPAIRWHARAVALACGLATGYLAAFGLIGLRTWA